MSLYVFSRKAPPFECTHRAQRTPGRGLSSQHAKLRPMRTSALRMDGSRIAGSGGGGGGVAGAGAPLRVHVVEG